MGTFNVQISIGDQQRAQWIDLDALVDTGASITSVPASVLRQLGVTPLMQQRFQFGQGEVRLMDVGQTWLRIEGREVVTLVLFNAEETVPLLGALALEGVFMGVNPVAKKLEPVEIAEIRPVPQPLAKLRPVGIDRGMTLPPSFFEPLPDDLLNAFGDNNEAT